MLEVIHSCQFASDLPRLHHLKVMVKSPMVGNLGSYSMCWLTTLPPSKKSEKDGCWCLAHSPVLFNLPNGAAHSGWVYLLLWNLSGNVFIEFLKVCFLTDPKANWGEDQDEAWLFTKDPLQFTNPIWEHTSPDHGLAPTGLAPTGYLWQCQSGQPHKRERCWSFVWQVPVKSSAICKLKLTALALKGSLLNRCEEMKRNKTKQKRWLFHRWTTLIVHLVNFTGSKQASSRDFLDWGKWGEKTHLEGRWYSFLGGAPEGNKTENELSTSLHLLLLPDCRCNMTSHLILLLPSLPWWFVHSLWASANLLFLKLLFVSNRRN